MARGGSGSSTITYSSTTGSSMNTGSGTFTAPVSGVYLIIFQANKNQDNKTVYVTLYAADNAVGTALCNHDSYEEHCSISATLYLAAGDQVNVRVTNNWLEYAELTGFLIEESLSIPA